MRKTYLLFTIISLAMISCTKDFREVKDIKEKENNVIAGGNFCTGNNWQLDQTYYKGSAHLVYSNKLYVFKHEVDRVLIYDGTSWDSIPSNIPFATNASFAFVIGSRGYLGRKTHHPNDETVPYFWEYNFLTNIWTEKADYPGPSIMTGAATFSIGNCGYVVGGLQYGFDFWSNKITWQYNQASNSWAKKADLPFPRSFASGFTISNKGYIVNGEIQLPLDGPNLETNVRDLVEYNPITDTWSVKALFPGEARSATTVFVIDGIAYAGGGLNYDISFKDFYKYTPSNNSWVKIADAPLYTGVGFSINSKGYAIFTGTNNNSYGLLKYIPFTCYGF